MRGKAYISYDTGASWTEIIGFDFMFQVWGYEPPPDPPPPPSISNWAVLAMEQELRPDGFEITAHTNIPCHLYMRYTAVEPQKHPEPVLRRGIKMHTDIRFCFVAYHENEQAEVGDTLVHTFLKLAWPVCETRWFYFVGTVAAEQQPSTSGIFKKHFPALIKECDGPEMWHIPVNFDYDQYAVFKAPTAHYPNYIALTLAKVGNPGPLTLSIHRLLASGYPHPEPLSTYTRDTSDLEVGVFNKFATFPMPPCHLGEGLWYALKASCPTPPGDEVRWKGWTVDICPDSYWIQHKLDTNDWSIQPNNELYYIIRGIPP
ncbi:hypothetical protein ES703_76898 [subsurface metagenome]